MSVSESSKDNPVISGFDPDYRNPRGIPRAQFVENVAEFVKQKGSVDNIMQEFQEVYSKYKFMEKKLTSNKSNLKGKVKEISSCLRMLKYLEEKSEAQEDVKTTFPLADNVSAKATISGAEKCYLWIGANVMVEYTLEEARKLLTENLETATHNLKRVEEDSAFLKEQVTTTEVSIARCYNYDVKQKRQQKSQQ